MTSSQQSTLASPRIKLEFFWDTKGPRIVATEFSTSGTKPVKTNNSGLGWNSATKDLCAALLHIALQLLGRGKPRPVSVKFDGDLEVLGKRIYERVRPKIGRKENAVHVAFFGEAVARSVFYPSKPTVEVTVSMYTRDSIVIVCDGIQLNEYDDILRLTQGVFAQV